MLGQAGEAYKLKEIRATLENLYPQGSEKGHRGGDQQQSGGKGRFQKRRWGHLADGEDSDEDDYEDSGDGGGDGCERQWRR